MPAHHIGSYVPIVSKRSAGKRSEVGRYEIRLKGHLASRWAAWFDGLSVTPETDGTATMSIETHFSDRKSMKQTIEMGFEQGLTETLNQVDPLLGD